MFARFIMVLILAAAGCGGSTSTATTSTIVTPDELTLYAIDGLVNEPAEFVTDDKHFRGYLVLGKVEITEPKARLEIMRAINDGISESDGTVASCFWPRHGVHVETEGKTIDFVICYECLQVYVFSGRERPDMQPTSEKHQAMLTDRLTAAGIKLAPSVEEKLSSSN